jgi:tRNA(adenine34) deaminase
MHPDWVFDSADHEFMEAALEEARAAGGRGEVPVGAVLVRGGLALASAGNQRESTSDPTAHAEILVLRDAGHRSRNWRLEGCTLYVTLEPCPMCLEACRQARIDLVVWGAPDPRQGACGSVVDAADDPRTPPGVAHRGGLLAERSRALLRDFFAKRRDSS